MYSCLNCNADQHVSTTEDSRTGDTEERVLNNGEETHEAGMLEYENGGYQRSQERLDSSTSAYTTSFSTDLTSSNVEDNVPVPIPVAGCSAETTVPVSELPEDIPNRVQADDYSSSSINSTTYPHPCVSSISNAQSLPLQPGALQVLHVNDLERNTITQPHAVYAIQRMRGEGICQRRLPHLQSEFKYPPSRGELINNTISAHEMSLIPVIV